MKAEEKLRIVLAVLAGLLALFLCVTKPGRRFSVAVFSPVGGMIADGAAWIMRVMPGGHGSSGKEDMEHLRERVASLTAANAEIDGLRRQNAQMRQMLGLRAPAEWQAVSAEVIGRDPLLWNEKLIINRGYDDGVATGAAVLVDQCVFGRVLHSDRHSAVVVQLTSPECSFGVELLVGGEQKRTVGVLRGAGDRLIDGRRGFIVEYLPPVVDVIEGQLVVTSGLGGWLPEGLPVGRVVPDAADGACLHVVDTARGELHCLPCVEDTTPYFVTVLRQNMESAHP